MDGNKVTANYSGGDILEGFLQGKYVDGEYLEFTYEHLNHSGIMKQGRCTSYPEYRTDGKIVLKESWQWTNGDQGKGTSVLIEI